MSSALNSIGPDEKKKLEGVIVAGQRVLQEMADLRDGLKDTVKSVSDEIGIKPAIINKVIRTVFKSSHEDDKTIYDTVEEILTITGHV